MIQDLFGLLLEELGTIIKIKLEPDKNNACLIKYPNGLSVQLDFDATSEEIIMLSNLGTPAPGRYRENLFREALKANGLPPPQPGIFAYSKKTDSLVLFTTVPLADTSGQKLADTLSPFMLRAELWLGAMARGEIPSFMGTELSFGKSGGGMFGL